MEATLTDLNRKNQTLSFLCMTTIAITVLTQVPSLANVFRPLMYVMWIVLLFVGVVVNSFRIPVNRFWVLYILTVLILSLSACFFQIAIVTVTQCELFRCPLCAIPLGC